MKCNKKTIIINFKIGVINDLYKRQMITNEQREMCINTIKKEGNNK